MEVIAVALCDITHDKRSGMAVIIWYGYLVDSNHPGLTESYYFGRDLGLK